jgi:hypothetical protein
LAYRSEEALSTLDSFVELLQEIYGDRTVIYADEMKLLRCVTGSFQRQAVMEVVEYVFSQSRRMNVASFIREAACVRSDNDLDRIDNWMQSGAPMTARTLRLFLRHMPDGRQAENRSCFSSVRDVCAFLFHSATH